MLVSNSSAIVRKLCMLVGMALQSCIVSASLADSANYGRFEGTVKAEWLNDRNSRAMKLLEPFAFRDPNDKKWSVPAGTIVDGASIPKAFWSIIGGPFEGSYRNASVVHDHYCVVRTEPWQDVHRMFYYGLRAAGTSSAKSKVMYYAVWVGGPRWQPVRYYEDYYAAKQFRYERIEPWAIDFDENVVSSDIAWIEQNDPPLEEVERRAARAFLGIEPTNRKLINEE